MSRAWDFQANSFCFVLWKLHDLLRQKYISKIRKPCKIILESNIYLSRMALLIAEFSLQSHKEYEVKFRIDSDTIRYWMSLLNYNCYIWQSKANFEIFVAIYWVCFLKIFFLSMFRSIVIFSMFPKIMNINIWFLLCINSIITKTTGDF